MSPDGMQARLAVLFNAVSLRHECV